MDDFMRDMMPFAALGLLAGLAIAISKFVQERPCPYCTKRIPKKAKVCVKCGRDVPTG